MISIFKIKKIDLILMGIIFATALMVRIVGINWGITHNFQPDEKKLVYSAVQMVQDGTFYHTSYIYPNQTIVHIAAVCMKMFASVPVRRGDVFEFYVIYRCVVAVVGALIIPIAYLIGNYVKQNMGWILATLVALFPPFVNYSKQVTGDMVVLFYSLVLVFFSILFFETRKYIYIPVMSFFAALATLEKWHGAAITLNIAFIIILVAVIEKNIFLFIKGGVSALISYVIFILLISPIIITNYDKLLNDLKWVYFYDEAPRIYDFTTLPSSFFSHFGFFTLCIIIVSIVYNLGKFICENDKYPYMRLFIVLICGIINYISMGLMMNRMFERWGLEFYFALLVIVAYFINTFALETNTKGIARILCQAYGICVLLSIITGTARIAATAVYSYNDNRIKGEDVYNDLQITIDNSVYEGYTTFSPGGIRDYSLGGSGQKEHAMDYYIYLDNSNNPHVRHKTANYAITSSYIKSNEDRASLVEYNILENYGRLLKVLPYENTDLFGANHGLGLWRYPELATVIENIKVVRALINGASSGPEMKIYDISGFIHDKE